MLIDLTAYPLDRLLSLANSYGLLTDYRLSPSSVKLVVGSDVMFLDPEEARLYLQGLIMGFTSRAASQGDILPDPFGGPIR